MNSDKADNHDINKLSQNAECHSERLLCHSERSEESIISFDKTLRFTQGDSFEIVSNTVDASTTGFSLLESLVVIAILVIIIAVTMPAFVKSRRNARSVRNMDNQRQIILAVTCFASNNDGKYPDSVATIGTGEYWNWQEPTMLTCCQQRSPEMHRSMGAYLGNYIKDANIMFCPNAPHGYGYLQQAWDAADKWDNPRTLPPQDPLIGTYCFYWNYTGFLESRRSVFTGPQSLARGREQSQLLVSDYFGYGHWRNPNSYGSCEKFRYAGITAGTAVSSDFWSVTQTDDMVDFDTLCIKLHAGFTDGHVESCPPSKVEPMRVSITPDGTVPYPAKLGPGIFFLPESAL